MASEQLQKKREAYEFTHQGEQRREVQSDGERKQQEDVCQAARRELSVIRGRVIFSDEDGNEVTITEKERSRMAAEYEALIKKNCD